ncbi:MAG: hypothetical protein CL773_03775 [Chloroflexi bacterium]|nr:hypothetical protein [Chloroflexota bacterium]|tara:strand:+ start:110 stop:727 length:618 start_codon:yes stop_codon:yes gene_type:complete
MNNKIYGSMMIFGPIVAMVSWIAFFPDNTGLNASEELAKIVESGKNSAVIGGYLATLATASMILGIYFLAKSVNTDKSISSNLAEIGGLLILLTFPVLVGLQGVHLAALDAADKVDAGLAQGILEGTRGFDVALSIIMGISWIILGTALTMKKKFYTVISAIFAIAGVFAILDGFSELEIFAIIGWMGGFLSMVIMGILTVINKE